MRNILVITFFLMVFGCKPTNPLGDINNKNIPEDVVRIKKLFKIQKPDSWYEHYLHGTLSYSPIGSRDKLVSDSNYLWINIFENKTSLIKYNEQKYNYGLWTRVKIKKSDYGLCYTDKRTFQKNGKTYMNLRDTYMYQGKVYELILFFENENFYEYLDEAVTIMESFEILKTQ